MPKRRAARLLSFLFFSHGPIKVEICLEQRERLRSYHPEKFVKICENLNFSTEIQIFANFAG